MRKLLRKIEELGWSAEEEDDGYRLAKFSPAGQDFSILVHPLDDPELFIENIDEHYQNFDCSEETYIWLDNTGHGTNGAPYDMRDLYNDMEACEKMILELHRELSIFHI